MGTPLFAVPSLIKCHEQHIVAGVVTVPDRPRGRGLKNLPSPVKETAVGLHLPVSQPESLLDPHFLMQLKEWNASLFVVVGFRILPPDVFTLPKFGTVNLHASLLPKYRGAAPIQWAIMNGETETGVTTFFIQQKVDLGDILLQRSVAIGNAETCGELTGRLAEIGSTLLMETVDLIAEGRAVPQKQTGIPSVAPKIQPGHCIIEWNRSAVAIVNQIRGLSPEPGANTTWEGRKLKITKAAISDAPSEEKRPGTAVKLSDGITVSASGGSVILREVQLEGKKKMPVQDFLRGNPIREGTVFGTSVS